MRKIYLFGILAALTPLLSLAAGQPAFELDVPAPELIRGAWLNTAGGKPMTLAARKGKVTILQFWTFG